MRSTTLLQLVFVIYLIRDTLAGNLTCYQCKRTTEGECAPSDLLPCPSSSDRCVTQISKSAGKGITIKRECGLAPCEFEDPLIRKGLGMMDCDRSRKEFSCVFCCRESGCNKGNKTVIKLPSKLLLLFAVLIVCLLNVTKHFIPPYLSG